MNEQQKRIGSAEFRNTHFSYTMLPEDVEKFVATPELQNEDSICDAPLPPGQVRVISTGRMDENPGLFRIECNEGQGVKILNPPPPAALKESVRCAEQNLYANARPGSSANGIRVVMEYTLQVRAYDASRGATPADRSNPSTTPSGSSRSPPTKAVRRS